MTDDLHDTAQRVRGKLYLVASPLDFGCDRQGDLRDTLPWGTLSVAAGLQYWICENAKSARAYLKRVHQIVPLNHSLQALNVQVLPHSVHKHGDHGGDFDARALLSPAEQGNDVGLLSEAGMPAIADPGSSVVRAAHVLGIEVVALSGPVSLMLALAASGLNGQNFAFSGYLPQEASQRARRIAELESIALRTGQTQLFIETPYRNGVMLKTLLQTLQPGTRLAVSSGLTLAQGICHCDTVQNWRRHGPRLDNATPAVFALGR